MPPRLHVSKRAQTVVLLAAAAVIAVLSIVFDWSGWLKWGLFILVMALIIFFITDEVRGGAG